MGLPESAQEAGWRWQPVSAPPEGQLRCRASLSLVFSGQHRAARPVTENFQQDGHLAAPTPPPPPPAPPAACHSPQVGPEMLAGPPPALPPNLMIVEFIVQARYF